MGCAAIRILPHQEPALTSHSTKAYSLPERALFRDGMSRVASAVHIVTTDGLAGLAGITANAVTSVSDEPPTLLACVNRASQSASRFVANKVFCVNVLSAQDQDLADRFAGRTGLHLEARFDAGAWRPMSTGAPALASAIVAFDCKITEIRQIATHHILIGEVVDMRLQREGACLAYHDRRYLTL